MSSSIKAVSNSNSQGQKPENPSQNSEDQTPNEDSILEESNQQSSIDSTLKVTDILQFEKNQKNLYGVSQPQLPVSTLKLIDDSNLLKDYKKSAGVYQAQTSNHPPVETPDEIQHQQDKTKRNHQFLILDGSSVDQDALIDKTDLVSDVKSLEQISIKSRHNSVSNSKASQSTKNLKLQIKPMRISQKSKTSPDARDQKTDKNLQKAEMQFGIYQNLLQGRHYQLDMLGNPIFDENQKTPKLKGNDVGVVPILGLPLFNLRERDNGITGTEKSDELWQVFSTMIQYQASYNRDGQKGKMPMELMIDQLDQNTEVNLMIDKARTYGVHINKHGYSDVFRKKMKTYQSRIDEYNKTIRQQDDEGDKCYKGADSPRNLKIETTKAHKLKKLVSNNRSPDRSHELNVKKLVSFAADDQQFMRGKSGENSFTKIQPTGDHSLTTNSHAEIHSHAGNNSPLSPSLTIKTNQSSVCNHKPSKPNKLGKLKIPNFNVKKVIVYEEKQEKLGLSQQRQHYKITEAEYAKMSKQQKIDLIRYGPDKSQLAPKKIAINLLAKYKPMIDINTYKKIASDLEQEAVENQRKIEKLKIQVSEQERSVSPKNHDEIGEDPLSTRKKSVSIYKKKKILSTAREQSKLMLNQYGDKILSTQETPSHKDENNILLDNQFQNVKRNIQFYDQPSQLNDISYQTKNKIGLSPATQAPVSRAPNVFSTLSISRNRRDQSRNTSLSKSSFPSRSFTKPLVNGSPIEKLESRISQKNHRIQEYKKIVKQNENTNVMKGITLKRNQQLQINFAQYQKKYYQRAVSTQHGIKIFKDGDHPESNAEVTNNFGRSTLEEEQTNKQKQEMLNRGVNTQTNKMSGIRADHVRMSMTDSAFGKSHYEQTKVNSLLKEDQTSKLTYQHQGDQNRALTIVNTKDSSRGPQSITNTNIEERQDSLQNRVDRKRRVFSSFQGSNGNNSERIHIPARMFRSPKQISNYAQRFMDQKKKVPKKKTTEFDTDDEMSRNEKALSENVRIIQNPVLQNKIGSQMNTMSDLPFKEAETMSNTQYSQINETNMALNNTYNGKSANLYDRRESAQVNHNSKPSALSGVSNKKVKSQMNTRKQKF